MADIKKLAGEGEGNGDGGGDRGPRGHRGHAGVPGSTGPTGPTGAGSGSSSIGLIAGAYVDGNSGATFAQTGFSSIVRVTDGHYLLTLANPPADDDLILPLVLPQDPVLSGNPVIFSVIGGVITLFTYVSTTGLLNDMNFYITVSVITP
jgi:hypothetical protein